MEPATPWDALLSTLGGNNYCKMSLVVLSIRRETPLSHINALGMFSLGGGGGAGVRIDTEDSAVFRQKKTQKTVVLKISAQLSALW